MPGGQIPTLGRVSSILTSRFRTPEGRHVMGQMLPPRSGATGGMEDPRRPFRTSPKSQLYAGAVLIGSENTRYLIMDNGVSERDGVEYRTFKTLALNRSANLLRPTKTLDPNTKRMVESLSDLGQVWFEMEPLRPMEDTFRVPTNQYSMVTNYAVKAGDQLGDLTITRVELRRGVYQFQGHSNGAE